MFLFFLHTIVLCTLSLYLVIKVMMVHLCFGCGEIFCQDSKMAQLSENRFLIYYPICPKAMRVRVWTPKYPEHEHICVFSELLSLTTIEIWRRATCYEILCFFKSNYSFPEFIHQYYVLSCVNVCECVFSLKCNQK